MIACLGSFAGTPASAAQILAMSWPVRRLPAGADWVGDEVEHILKTKKAKIASNAHCIGRRDEEGREGGFGLLIAACLRKPEGQSSGIVGLLNVQALPPAEASAAWAREGKWASRVGQFTAASVP